MKSSLIINVKQQLVSGESWSKQSGVLVIVLDTCRTQSIPRNDTSEVTYSFVIAFAV